MKLFLTIVSIPFFMIGFAWSFILQAIEDGIEIEKRLRNFLDD